MWPFPGTSDNNLSNSKLFLSSPTNQISPSPEYQGNCPVITGHLLETSTLKILKRYKIHSMRSPLPLLGHYSSSKEKTHNTWFSVIPALYMLGHPEEMPSSIVTRQRSEAYSALQCLVHMVNTLSLVPFALFLTSSKSWTFLISYHVSPPPFYAATMARTNFFHHFHGSSSPVTVAPHHSWDKAWIHSVPST